MGFKNNEIFLPILQAFLSIHLIGDLIKLYIFVYKNGNIYEELRVLFSDIRENKDYNYEPKIVKIAIEYEANLIWANINLDSKIYNKLNPELSDKWEEMKVEYKIIEAKNE